MDFLAQASNPLKRGEDETFVYEWRTRNTKKEKYNLVSLTAESKLIVIPKSTLLHKFL